MSNELFDLSGRTAIVTGTSRGLGQSMARALARAGADLVLTSRNRSSLSEFKSEIEALGRRALSMELDVRNLESIHRMVAAAEETFGHLDILVNNAGCNVRKPALDVTWDDWNLILDTQSARQFFRGPGGGTPHGIPLLRANHQYRFGHQCCWLCWSWPLRRQPRRRTKSFIRTKNGWSISAIAFL